MKLYKHMSPEGKRGRRFFWHLSNEKESMVFLDGRVEGYVFSGASHTGVELSFDDDSTGLSFFVGLAHVFCLWVTLGSPLLGRWIYKRFGQGPPEVNIVNFRYHDRALWWEIWHSKWSWTSGTPRWRSGNFQWWDWMAGKPVHNSEVTKVQQVKIPMPEGSYEATVTLSFDTWKRSRWPWPQIRHGYNLDVNEINGKPGYIPVPGKGENSWDCGGDGIFGQSGSARTVEEAIGHVVGSALRDRQRRIGRHDYADPIS